MAINFNVDPWYDDFDPSKNYHRILFRPGRAVQARELTQSQTILQNQISKFADAIFSQNTPVTGGKITLNTNCYYLKLNSQYNGVDIVAETFMNMLIQDVTGAVVAKVIKTEEATGTDTAAGDPPTLIVNYLSGGRFTDDMQIYPVDGTNYFATTIGNVGEETCTGLSSTASISEGVFYIRNGYYLSQTQNEDGTYSKYAIGHFVSVQPQTIILNKYDATPSYRVGLGIWESTKDYIDDPSLLDPAVGASNYQAPGADRYEIYLQLTKLPLALGNDDQFIEITRVQNGTIVRQFDSTVYSVIDDYFSKKIYDTSGDFVINNFALQPVANTANTEQYDIRIGKGTAYIQGYRVDSYQDSYLTNERARSYESVNNNSVYADYGSYFYVNTLKGVFDVTTAFPVDLHCVDPANIVSTNTSTYNSTVVAKGYIRGLDYVSSTSSSNTQTYIYKAHLYGLDAKTISGNVTSSSVNGITLNPNPAQLSSVANAYYGVVLTINSGTGAGYRGLITKYDPSTFIANVSPSFAILPDNTSKFSLRFDTTDVNCIANTTTGTTTVVASAYIDTLGKTNNVQNSDTIFQNPNNEELIFPIGEQYVKGITDSSYYSTKVFRNKSFSGTGTVSLTLVLPVGIQNSVDFEGGVGTLSADAIKENYTVIITSTTDSANNGTVGSILDFTSSGNTVSISGDKNSVTFSSTHYKTSLTVTVIAKVAITNASDTQNILKTKTLVSGNTSTVSYAGPDGIIDSNTYIDLTNAQVYIKKAALVSSGAQSLYVTDVKKIKKIIDTGDSGTVPTTTMLDNASFDITKNYRFNNGQKDSYYDHSYLTLAPGAPKPKGNILVIFDYYSHSSADGYYSKESYVNESYSEIPSYTAKNSKVYNLRDCVDFRPSRKNSTSTFLFETSALISTSDAGTYLPQDLTNFLSDYSYYLSRTDKLILSKDRKFEIVKGNPGVIAVEPTEPNGSLLLATLVHEPYTAYLPTEAPAGVKPNMSVLKTMHRRWTMAEISGLSNRINNLEYYTSLNVLEQKAQNLQITDANGLNRFKNGILVDDFSSLTVADTGNPDYSVNVDNVKKKLQPLPKVTNYQLQSINALNSLGRHSESQTTLGYRMHNINKATNVFTLPYNTVSSGALQQFATQTVNVNPFSVTVTEGTMYLNPPMDNWVDNTREPDLLIVDPAMKIYTGTNTLNTLDATAWKTIPGTQKSTTDVSSVVSGRTTTVTTTTTTTSLQNRTTTSGYWQQLAPNQSYMNDNGYLTNIQILPYIREQQIYFNAKGLKINTDVSVFFDGQNVTQYISSPDVLELQDEIGTFKADDIIGYFDNDNGKFYPLATVTGVYRPTGTNATKKVRLYIISNKSALFGTINASRISNAFLKSDGTYGSSTASAGPLSAYITPIKYSGVVTSCGVTWTDTALNGVQIYKRLGLEKFDTFSKVNGIWSSVDGTGEFDVTFNLQGFNTKTLYFEYSSSCFMDVFIDGTKRLVVDLANNNVNKVSNTTLTNAITGAKSNVRIRGYTTGTGNPYNSGNAFVALAISNVPVKAGDPSVVNYPKTVPTLYWSTGSYFLSSGNALQKPASGPATTVTAFDSTKRGAAANARGGQIVSAVSQINLGPEASKVDSWYVGSGIQVTSYLYKAPGKGETAASRVTNTKATQKTSIIAYDGITRTATLSNPVDVSMGYNMDCGDISTTYSITGTKTSYKLVTAGPVKLSTDESGTVSGVFHVPPNRFTTGQKVLRVDNRLTANDPASATSYAEGTFWASSLSTRSQAINFSPTISAAKRTITTTSERTVTDVNVSVQKFKKDPLCQTFIFDKEIYPTGLFLSSVKLFFKTKPKTTNSPVTVSIVGTLNGYPKGETLDYSQVTLTADQVKTSDTPHYLDSNAYTEFVFHAPVYVQPGILYAILVETPSDEFNLYIASQNAIAIPSSAKEIPTAANPTSPTKIGTIPYVGNLFESQNGVTWVPDLTKSMMFVLNRCEFLTSYNPRIAFCVPAGLHQRKLVTNDIEHYYDYRLSQTATSSLLDRTFDAFNVTTTHLNVAKSDISYTYETMLASDESFESEVSLVPGNYAAPTYDDIYLNDNKGQRILKANANTFFVYATLSSNDGKISPVLADDGLTLFTIQNYVNNLGLSNNTISLLSPGSGYSNNESGNTTVSFSTPDLPGGEQAYGVADVDETTGQILDVFVTYPGSGYLNTPTVSIVDANTTPGTGASAVCFSEYSPSGGNAYARYITKKTTLTQENESQDLRVFLSGYRPVNGEIYVFYRIQNRVDTSEFEELPWQLMTYVNNSQTAFSVSMNDIKEFECGPGTNYVADNQISYQVNGTTYTSFNSFQIKVVLTSSDTTNPPFLTDMRVIALPSGTGI